MSSIDSFNASNGFTPGAKKANPVAACAPRETKPNQRLGELAVGVGTHVAYVFSERTDQEEQEMQVMKLGSLAVSLVAAQLLWSAPAQATLINDFRVINATLTPYSPSYTSTSSVNNPSGTSFDLTDDGVPAIATVNWASVTFSLLDYDGRKDSVYAFLGGDMLYGQSNPIGISAFGGLVNGTVVGLLNVTGTLDYTLNLFGGSSVTVLNGSLVADVTSVPEPGTFTLMGAGLLAAWLGARRRTRKQ